MPSSCVKYLSLLLLLFGAACSKKQDVNFDGSVQIRLSEKLDSNQRSLILYCRTVQQYGCSNFQIRNSVQQSGNDIRIIFSDVATSRICATAIGPATATIPLGTLQEGTYNLTITTGDTRYAGTLTVTPDRFQVSMTGSPKIQFTETTMNRVPAQTIFGTIHYIHTQNTTAALQFLNDLLTAGATPRSYLPGKYEEFEVDAYGAAVQRQDPGYPYTYYFIYRYAGDPAALKPLVRSYGIAHKDSLYIMLKSDRGHELMSWMP